MTLLAADQPPPLWLIVLFLVLIAGAVLSILWRCVAFLIRGRAFPRTACEDILFRERFASGGSLDGPWFRRGAGRNCLKITITKSELWVCGVFPFRLFDREVGLQHRIPLARIVTATGFPSSPGKIQLEFVDESGETRRFELHLRQSRTFLDVLESVVAKRE